LDFNTLDEYIKKLAELTTFANERAQKYLSSMRAQIQSHGRVFNDLDWTDSADYFIEKTQALFLESITHNNTSIQNYRGLRHKIFKKPL